ncbi:MAG: hypothetical protein ACREJ0_30375 [Geminicoccaceae bacterium]
MNIKKSQANRAVSILARILCRWRHMFPGAVMVVAMAGATPALAQVTGDDIPPIVDEGNQFALPCDTSFIGCRVDNKKVLAVPSGDFQLFLEGTEFNAVGRGQGLIFFLGKRVNGISSEEVCVTTVRRGGNPALRERVNCVEIGVDPDDSGFCADGGCTSASTCPDQPALSIGTDAAVCAGLLPILQDAYNVPDDVQLAYAMAYSGGSNTGQENWARVVKCSSAIRHRCTPHTLEVVGAGMREEPVLFNNPTSTGGSRYR